MREEAEMFLSSLPPPGWCWARGRVFRMGSKYIEDEVTGLLLTGLLDTGL